jgi:ubiquitin carboxyl-terminal hydrolase 5/13
MFRSLIGKGHMEFSSNRQQDAGEFLNYFLDKLGRAERTALGSRLEAGKPLASLFDFAVEERKEQQTESRGVVYTRQKQNMLMVPIKIDDAENLAEVTAYRNAHGYSEEKEAKKPKTEGEPEEPKPIIQLRAALDRWAAPEDGIEFRGAKATKTTKLATMPRYLLIQVQRYSVNEKWMPVKIDCKVPMPESISLEHLRGKGLQPGETELKDEGPAPSATATSTSAAAPQPDETIVAQLLSMGLTENGAKRAALGVQNASADMAAAWYFEHMEDPDINDPLPAPGEAGKGGSATGPDPALVAELSSFGFAEKHVIAALKACNNSSERAADWLFSHSDDLDSAVAALDGGGESGGGGGDSGSAEDYDDGVGEYSLVGFISHIGRHPSHGHYVCHARRGPGGEWVIFDDQKVALSEAPPFDLGYIYLYRRKDVA